MRASNVGRAVASTAMVLALAACDRTTKPEVPLVETIGIVEGIAIDAQGTPVDSVRVLVIGPPDGALYSFRQALTGPDGAFSVTVYREAEPGVANPPTVVMNVIATAYKGFQNKPESQLVSKYVAVETPFAGEGETPTPVTIQVKF